MLTLGDYEEPVVESPMPDVGEDLMRVEAQGYLKEIMNDHLLATLEMLRHQVITVEQAAILVGVPRKDLIEVLKKLPIEDFRRLDELQ